MAFALKIVWSVRNVVVDREKCVPKTDALHRSRLAMVAAVRQVISAPSRGAALKIKRSVTIIVVIRIGPGALNTASVVGQENVVNLLLAQTENTVVVTNAVAHRVGIVKSLKGKTHLNVLNHDDKMVIRRCHRSKWRLG